MPLFLSPAAITQSHFPSPCIPGTRVTVISQIIDWLTDESRVSNVFWLYGPIGSGKSTVARTIWDRSEELGLPCSYISPTENSQLPSPLLQIAQCFGDSWVKYWEVIKQNHCLLDPALRLDRFISSFTPEPSAKYPHHYLVILDGLEPRHLPLISLIIPQGHRPSPNPRILWMICSRSFLEFRESLTTRRNMCIWLSVLDAGEEGNEHDIKMFLEDGLKKLDKTVSTSSAAISSGETWRPPDAITRLAQKTSGSFIFANRLLQFMNEKGKSVTSLQDRLSSLFMALDDPLYDVPIHDALWDLYRSIFKIFPFQFGFL